jgi:hypothetical protein
VRLLKQDQLEETIEAKPYTDGFASKVDLKKNFSRYSSRERSNSVMAVASFRIFPD